MRKGEAQLRRSALDQQSLEAPNGSQPAQSNSAHPTTTRTPAAFFVLFLIVFSWVTLQSPSFVPITSQFDRSSSSTAITRNGGNDRPKTTAASTHVNTTASSVASTTNTVRVGGSNATNNACPLVFGIGHQKSGTTTVVKAIGSISEKTSRNDVMEFWNERQLTDDRVLEAIHPSRGLIQKEGHGMFYADQMARVCPQMRWYVVRRDPLAIVRSIADRHGIEANKNCTTLGWLAKGWIPVFNKSNDTSCLIRLAASVADYNMRVEKFIKDHHDIKMEEIWYDDYVKDRLGSTQKLCKSLQVLGPCDATQKLDTKQYQGGKGKNRGKNLTEIWPANVLERMRMMVNASA